MERTIHIGLLNYPDGASSPPIDVTIQLKDTDRGSVLKIVGQIGNNHYGQICDELTEHIDDIVFTEGWNKYRLMKLLEVWGHWNLNDMFAGSPAQTEIIRHWRKTVSYPDNDYTAQCAELERHGLLVDNGYKFGTDWLFRPLPVSIEAEMRDLIGQQ